MTKATIVKDSIFMGNRITSFVLTAPRYILCEINTHAMTVRNTASSRAIPVKRRIEGIRENMAAPPWWGANQAGMVATAEVGDPVKAATIWKEAGLVACDYAMEMEKYGVHKQIANRIAESYSWVTVLCTTTEPLNHFALRCDEFADPAYDELAGHMLGEFLASTPEELKEGQWHMPFDIGKEAARMAVSQNFPLVEDPTELLVRGLQTLHLPGMEKPASGPLRQEWKKELLADLIQLFCSVSLAGRVSYETHEKEFTPMEGVTHAIERIIRPGHWSPAGHQAQAIDVGRLQHKEIGHLCETGEKVLFDLGSGDAWWAQLRNWRQFRKLFRNENREPDLADLNARYAQWEVRRAERGIA